MPRRTTTTALLLLAAALFTPACTRYTGRADPSPTIIHADGAARSGHLVNASELPAFPLQPVGAWIVHSPALPAANDSAQLRAAIHDPDSIALISRNDRALLHPWRGRSIKQEHKHTTVSSAFDGPPDCLIAIDPITLAPLTDEQWSFVRPTIEDANLALYTARGIILANDTTASLTVSTLHVFANPPSDTLDVPTPDRTITLDTPHTIRAIIESTPLWTTP